INIVQRRDVLLPNEDEDVSKKITEVLSRRYKVHTGFQTTRVQRDGTRFRVHAESSGRSIDLESDQLLVATGRTPNTDTLDLEKAGVKTDGRGHIITDAFLETTSSGIFALGDAVGRYQFKHSANHEAQYAFANMIHPDKKIPVDYFAMPHGVFSWPQVAGVGMTEQDARKAGLEYLRSVYPYSGAAMGEAIEEKDGFVKFLVDRKTRRILGCHIMGAEASILIHEVLVAMRAGDGTIDGLARTIFIHPSLSEVVARAAYAV
ncbi:MAG: FAD-dependent oxidoreductase, partial [Thaumarchaeota archaeon]|nr:FAD-dependent oxidoreductase [Nitrososphaerota archaeon]